MEPKLRGMVQVNRITYRIVRVRARQYEVVRVLDDQRVGMFSLGGNSGVGVEGGAPELIRDVARVAIQGGRTSWVPRFATAR